MTCVYDPHDKLDEIAIVFAWNYYAIQNAGVEHVKDLGLLYSDVSVGGWLRACARMCAGMCLLHVFVLSVSTHTVLLSVSTLSSTA